MDFNEIEPFWIHFGHFLDTCFKTVGRYKLDTFLKKGCFYTKKGQITAQNCRLPVGVSWCHMAFTRPGKISQCYKSRGFLDIRQAVYTVCNLILLYCKVDMANPPHTNTFQSPFAALVAARELAHLVQKDTLLAAFASSNVKVFPYQVAAASFAWQAQYQKGAVLCDEGSLGKTYEALLIAAQKWIEGRTNILIILPPNLITQWEQKINTDFSLPSVVWRSGALPKEEALILTTYDFAVKNADILAHTTWDLVIFDEADYLFKPTNKSVQTLKAALPHTFKLLLTPTPITMSIMDVYGLLHFIDETALPPEDEFYARYFRKPENYPELSAFVSPYCFRTLKKQVSQYVGFSRRIPATLDYTLTPSERTLYELTERYLKRPTKTAYPLMDAYELTLLFYHTLSSSPRALAAMLDAPIFRTHGEERDELQTLQAAARQIAVPAKFSLLADTLRAAFKHFRTHKLAQKAVVFVNNTTTLKELADYLTQQKFRVLTYKDDSSIAQFRTGPAEVLLTLDAAAKGLDMEFCPAVVNYDLLYNAVEMEQRICRCHRQGQTADVLVVNLLSRHNVADVRILELINKRTLQFDGIFGSSDDILGTFTTAINDVLPQVRPVQQTMQDIKDTLQSHRADNEKTVSQAEDILFTTFSKEVADKVTLTPKYVHEQAEDLNARLWTLARYFFADRKEYQIDEEHQTVTLTTQEAPVLFYYYSGGRNKPYTGKKCYGAAPNFKPASNRITFTSLLGKGILEEIETPNEAVLTIPTASDTGEIGFYRVRVQDNTGQTVYEEDVLIGRTQAGKPLSPQACRELLNLPVSACRASDNAGPYWLKGMTGSGPHAPELEALLDTKAIITHYQNTGDTSTARQAERLTLKVEQKKARLDKYLYNLRNRTDALRRQIAASAGQWEELKLQKQLAVAKRDLLKAEEEQFFKRMKIEAELEDALAALNTPKDVTVKVTPLFVLTINR